MYTFLIVLICIAAVLLVLVVLAQNPKSGMAANFASSNQVIGVRQTADFLEKFTWGLAIAIVVLSLAASLAVPSKETITAPVIQQENVLNGDNADGINPEALPLAPVTQSPSTQSEDNTNQE